MQRKSNVDKFTQEQRDEQTRNYLAMVGTNPVDVFPDDNDKRLPEEGGWIQVIMPPNTMQYVHYLGIYYAVPVEEGEINFTIGGHKPYFVKVLTETGEVRLYPSEYIKFNNIYQFLESDADKQVTINWLAPRNEDYDRDLLHYIQSRGVSKADAYQMLLGTIKSQNVCFLTLSKEIQEYFAGVGVNNLNARSVILTHINSTPATKEQVERQDKLNAEYEKAAKERDKETKRLIAARKKQEKQMKNLFRW